MRIDDDDDSEMLISNKFGHCYSTMPNCYVILVSLYKHTQNKCLETLIT